MSETTTLQPIGRLDEFPRRGEFRNLDVDAISKKPWSDIGPQYELLNVNGIGPEDRIICGLFKTTSTGAWTELYDCGPCDAEGFQQTRLHMNELLARHGAGEGLMIYWYILPPDNG